MHFALLVAFATGFAPNLRTLDRRSSFRASMISMDADLAAKVAALEAQLADAKVAALEAQLADAQAKARASAQTIPTPTLDAVPPVEPANQESAAAAMQELTAAAIQEPAAAAIQEPAAAAADALLQATTTIQEPAAAVAETLLQATPAAIQEPMATATINAAGAQPLLLVLGLSVIPLVVSVVKALDPSLFTAAEDKLPRGDPAALYAGKRDAQQIFFAGLENVKAEPTGWMFGKPSALYSNAKSPPPMAAPMPPPQPVPSAPTSDIAALSVAPPLTAEAPATPTGAAPLARPAPAARAGGSSNRFEKRLKKRKKGRK